MINHKYQSGQSLFELVVAIAISALIIVAIVSLTTNSIQTSNFSKNKAQASTYAQEATEWLRGQRDVDVSAFVTHASSGIAPGGYCLPTLGWDHFVGDTTQGCTTPISGTILKRWVTFDVSFQNGKTVVRADIVVLWSDSGGAHEVKNATNFADLR